jgi:hypothetical protein
MKLLIGVGAVALAGTVATWITAVPTPPTEEHSVQAGAPAPAAMDTVALRTSATRLRARDPFRLDRKPADVQYNPWQATTVAPPPAPPPIRPPLALAGLLGGPPWSALIEGIPGREGGVLLQMGDSASGVRFVAVRGDTVILAAFDTTWALTEKRAWR